MPNPSLAAPGPLAASVQSFIDSGTLAGAVMLACTREKVLSVETAGFADVAAGVAMRDDALFWIASMTKPITAAAFMMLVDEGRASLDDTVEQYIPAFKGQMMVGARNAAGDLVTLVRPPRAFTIREAFSHLSGMPFFSRPELLPTLKIDAYPLEIASMGYAMSALEYPPGTKYQYGNTAINSVGRVIEVITGQAFDAFLRERFFEPLGMIDTAFVPSEPQAQRLAKSYRPHAETKELEEIGVHFLTYPLSGGNRHPCPGGGLFSTARDVARFGQMILSGGTFEGRQYLSPEAIRAMTTTHTGSLHLRDATNPEAGYGIGWETSRVDAGDAANADTAVLGPCGHGGAYATHLGIDPQRDLVTVFMVQHNGFANDAGGPIRTAFLNAARSLTST